MYLRVLAVALVIVLGLIGWRYFTGPSAFETLAAAPHHQYVGAENPKITIVEVMDYRCPYCRAIHDTMVAFVALHPEVRVVYRVYPIFGEQSIREGKIAMAAGARGKFAEMHNKLIRREAPVTPEDLDQLISELDLNKEQFKKDMTAWAATKDMLDGASAVKSLGITATPTLVVEGDVVSLKSGVPDVAALEKLLEKYLKPAMTKAPE